MSHYQKHPVTLTQKQFSRLGNGHTVQLAHHQIAHGAGHRHHMALHPMNFKKVHKAARAQKGVRLALSPEEFHASGEGFMDFIKKAGSWLKKNIIDTDVYQKNIKPIVHNLIDQGINTGATLIGSKTGPLGQQIAGDVGRAAANKFYEATGTGMRRRGGAIKGGYDQFRYGHGTSQGDVAMSARDIRKTIPASEFTPLLAPSVYPSVIQHQGQVKGRGLRKPRGGSFRMN